VPGNHNRATTIDSGTTDTATAATHLFLGGAPADVRQALEERNLVGLKIYAEGFPGAIADKLHVLHRQSRSKTPGVGIAARQSMPSLVILEDVELESVSNSNDGCCVADSPGEAARSGRAVQTVGTPHVSAIIRNSVKPGCCRRVITQKNMTAPTKLAVF